MSPGRDLKALRADNPSGYQRLRALVAAFLVLSMLAVSAAIGGLIYLALNNRDLIEQVRTTNHRLIDCTTPGGDCYQQSQQRTGEAIVGINEGTLRVIAAALSCQADGLTDERELARCTTRRAAD